MNLPLTGERICMTPLTETDLPEALQIYHSNPAYNELRNGSAAFSLNQLEEEYRSLSMLPGSYWLAITLRDDERMIGIGHLRLEQAESQKGWISLLLLAANFQRSGFGREVVKLVEEFVRCQSKTQIHVGVVADHISALLFWGKLGYEQYRQVIAPVGRLTRPVLLLAKHL
ncbi:GNAT family N-acetyltransferase [Brevibacillus fulvus]|uniref:RimJ/RimL family protein N-acetyltransferase n=1 Tax=Brevibacillus fulvus TaxID=1125967 RepID=A0A939BRT2_9BACL|nr:GNAT family N-acetyltransferase [Brevibacillus fulvus]MBM7589773.1 RimJ/RimL family protein N-acetyltransferase [Brevibacillus fulvus]